MKYRAPSALRDAYPGTSQTELNAILTVVQEAVFETVSVTQNGRRRKTDRFDVHVNRIANAAAEGDKGAAHENVRLLRFMQKVRTTQPAQPSPTQEKDILQLAIEKQKQLVRHIERSYAECLLFLIRSAVNEEYGKVYGEREYIMEELFEDMPQTIERMKEIKKAEAMERRKENKGKPYENGYKRPPVKTRWTTSGNPSGVSKAISQTPLYSLEKALLAEVSIVAGNDKKTKSTKLAIAIRRLYQEAAKGEAAAYRPLRMLFEFLLDNDRMRPPAPKPKKRKAEAYFTRSAVLMVPFVKQDIIERLTDKYGLVPPFVTLGERLFEKIFDGTSPPEDPAKREWHELEQKAVTKVKARYARRAARDPWDNAKDNASWRKAKIEWLREGCSW